MADVEHVMGKLGPALLRRFESNEGYIDFAETLDVCESSFLLIPFCS